MALEIKLGNRIAKVELLAQSGNQVKIMVDDKEYDLDCNQVEKGIYSILFKGRSYNVELIETDTPKKYSVNTFHHSYEAEIIDAETKYLKARMSGNEDDEQGTTCSPMPGKVVKIPVLMGAEVKKGDTVIIISAMKMESEYKAGKDGIISEIFVKEEDVVKANQALVQIE